MADKDETIIVSRWLWYLFPLDPNALSSRQNPVHEHQIGTVVAFKGFVHSGGGQIVPVNNQYYVPTDEDFALVERFSPSGMQGNPDWHLIEAFLVENGHDPALINQRTSVVLLALLRKAVSPKQNEESSQSTERDDYKTAKWFEKHTTINGDSLRKAVADGKFLPTYGPKNKKRYSLAAAKLLWGEDVVKPAGDSERESA